MASIPTIFAIRIVKCCQIIVCDSRIVGLCVFGVEAHTHCLLKIPLNVTLTLARCSLWKICCRDRIYLFEINIIHIALSRVAVQTIRESI
jgi:hypothetical protein